MNKLFITLAKHFKVFNFLMAIPVVLAGSLCYNANLSATEDYNTKKVPNFQLTTLDNPNKKVSHALFKDKITVLNVWSSDCGACKDEHGYLLKLAKNSDISLIGVDLMDDRNAAQDWLAREGNPYELVIFDDNGKLSKGLGVYGTPQTFIIDGKGTIHFSHLGELTDSVWRNKMQPIIKSLTKNKQSNVKKTD